MDDAERSDKMAQVSTAQVAVYVMCGGSLLGRFAAEQPADFYIDTRVGRLPYTRREIGKAVAILQQLATEAGLNPHDLPKMPRFHNLGVF